MKPAAPLKELVSVGELLRRRLKETKRTPEELAEADEWRLAGCPPVDEWRKSREAAA